MVPCRIFNGGIVADRALDDFSIDNASRLSRKRAWLCGVLSPGKRPMNEQVLTGQTDRTAYGVAVGR